VNDPSRHCKAGSVPPGKGDARARRPVAADADGAAIERVADEIADGKMAVERQQRPDEGECASDDRLDAPARVAGAEQLRQALAFAVGGARLVAIRAAGVFLGHMRNLGRLWPIDGAGAGEKEAARAGLDGEIKRAAGAGDDGVDHAQRLFFIEPGACLRGGVDEE
jgi:hypothetical protein